MKFPFYKKLLKTIKIKVRHRKFSLTLFFNLKIKVTRFSNSYHEYVKVLTGNEIGYEQDTASFCVRGDFDAVRYHAYRDYG